MTYHSHIRIEESESQQSMATDGEDGGNEHHENVATNSVD